MCKEDFRFHEATPHASSISAADDLQNPDKIRTLLKDLREARQAKSREGLKKLDHIALTVQFFLASILPQ
jgi:GINS complex subunit 2